MRSVIFLAIVCVFLILGFFILNPKGVKKMDVTTTSKALPIVSTRIDDLSFIRDLTNLKPLRLESEADEKQP